jgi:hypothetical protein
VPPFLLGFFLSHFDAEFLMDFMHLNADENALVLLMHIHASKVSRKYDTTS